ncbi:MAG: hypothetical protein Tsb005_00230 [Gammaproteobacteria bacterium]
MHQHDHDHEQQHKKQLNADITAFKTALNQFVQRYSATLSPLEIEHDLYLRFVYRNLRVLDRALDEITNQPQFDCTTILFNLNEALQTIYCHNQHVTEDHQRHYASFYQSEIIHIVDKHIAHFGIPNVKQFRAQSKILLTHRSQALKQLDNALGKFELTMHKIRAQEPDHAEFQHVDDIALNIPQRVAAGRELLNAINEWLTITPADDNEYELVNNLKQSTLELLNYLYRPRNDANYA